MEIRVVELFAGVGGFRVGLEQANRKVYKTVLANQWEPRSKIQHAYNCYVAQFGSKNVVNEDIAKIKSEIPDHDLLVGGFPCQDYSTAATKAQGIKGKKGVLWWEIRDIIMLKSPKYILLENVDRLIKSPINQKGRDFSIMLKSLDDLGYTVEWRIINAADFGFFQKRKRVFLFCHKRKIPKVKLYNQVLEEGFFQSIFKIKGIKKDKSKTRENHLTIKNKTLSSLTKSFSGRFWNSGIMSNGNIYTCDLIPLKEKSKKLKSIVKKTQKIESDDFLSKSQIDKMKYLKSSKKIPRVTKDNFKYTYTEGKMSFPEDLEKPARTLLTSERGLNRSTHVIEDYKTKKLRFLTPEETEKINGFKEGWTNLAPKKMRFFLMGNALVCGLIKKMGLRIIELEEDLNTL